jgi:hypothetical protein
MLSESVQTSIAALLAAGESVRVVGMNPFIIAPERKEGLDHTTGSRTSMIRL